MTSRGIRNNNPGNIRHGQPWQGLAAEQTDEAFATFTTMAWGIRALVTLLRTYRSAHRLTTVREIIGRWAPPTENDTAAYVAAVCAPAGLRPDEELPDTRTTYEYLARRIAHQENGADAELISTAHWQAGLDLAFGAGVSAAAAAAPDPAPPRQVGTGEAIAAAPVSTHQPTTERRSMAPFIAAAIPMLIEQIPALVRLFGKGARSEENAQTAEKVVEIVKAATGSSSIEEAVNKVTREPAARQAASEAIEQRFYQLAEAGGGGIEGARAFSLAAASDPGGTPFWKMPAYWITMAVLPLLYYTVHLVLTGTAPGFSGELKAAIASSVVTGILGGVLGFWLGSSFTTSKSRGLGSAPTQGSPG